MEVYLLKSFLSLRPSAGIRIKAVATADLKSETNSLLEYEMACEKTESAIQGFTQVYNSNFLNIYHAPCQSLSLECKFNNSKYNYTIEYLCPGKQPYRLTVQTDHPFAILNFKLDLPSPKHPAQDLIKLYSSPHCDVDLAPLQNFKLELRNNVLHVDDCYGKAFILIDLKYSGLYGSGVHGLTADINDIDNTFIARSFGDIFHTDLTTIAKSVEHLDYVGNRNASNAFTLFIGLFRNLHSSIYEMNSIFKQKSPNKSISKTVSFVDARCLLNFKMILKVFVKVYHIYFVPAIQIWDKHVESTYPDLKLKPKPANPLSLSEDIISLNREIYYTLKSTVKEYVELYSELSSKISFTKLADSPLPTEDDLPKFKEEILLIISKSSKAFEAHKLLNKKTYFYTEHIIENIFKKSTFFDSFYDEIKKRLDKAGIFKTMEKVDDLIRQHQARSLRGMFWRTVQPYYAEKTFLSFIECCVRSVYPNKSMIVNTSTVQPTISYLSERVDRMYFREGVTNSIYALDNDLYFGSNQTILNRLNKRNNDFQAKDIKYEYNTLFGGTSLWAVLESASLIVFYSVRDPCGYLYDESATPFYFFAVSTDIFTTLSDSLVSTITAPETIRFNMCVLNNDIWVASLKSTKESVGHIALLKYSSSCSSPAGLVVKETLNTTLEKLYPRLVFPKDADEKLVKEFQNPECLIAADGKWLTLLVVNSLDSGIADDECRFKLRLMAFQHEDIENEHAPRSYLDLDTLVGNEYYSWGTFCTVTLISRNRGRPIIMIALRALPFYRIFKVATNGRIFSLTAWKSLTKQIKGSVFYLDTWGSFLHAQYLQSARTFLLTLHTPTSPMAKDDKHSTPKMHFVRAVLKGV